MGDLVVIDNLTPELLASEPSVITNACKTLQTFYNINQTTSIILDAVIKEITKSGKDFSNETIIALSHSLKWMYSHNSYVLESLEDKMYRGDTDMIRDTSRLLISEMGGSNAIKKLEVKSLIKDGYNQQINRSQEEVENMFHVTIIDAKRGFNISMAMEIIVFFTGIVSLMVLINYTYKIFPSIEDVERKSFGTLFYCLSLFCLIYLFWDKDPYALITGFFIMTFGDGLAGLIGKSFNSKSWIFFKQKKSLFGTMTMFLTSLIVVCSIGYAQQNSLNLNYFTIAFFATLLEQFSVLGIDNFIVPISSALFFNFFITS